jgi:NAD(P)-dependent dehydrogenase (short-subunit alcohol dehydrogenase family)
VALATGGGSGLGEAIAKTLAGQGVTVVVSDIIVQAAERVAEEIRDTGERRFLRCSASGMYVRAS